MVNFSLSVFIFASAWWAARASSCDPSTFDKWAMAHGRRDLLKGVSSPEERALRLELFCKTEQKIKEHNLKYMSGHSTFFMRHNQFSAHTAKEWKAVLGYRGPTSSPSPSFSLLPAQSKSRHASPISSAANVSAIDWRQHGKVSSVKNQGSCGSCWAFSAIGAMEGAVSIAENFSWNTSDSSAGYSVDQCLECAQGTMGCEGGYPWLCYDHIIQNGGIDSEQDWPYLSDSCNRAKEKFEKVASISRFHNVTDGDEVGLRSALVQQPVSVAVRANCGSFRYYGGGVLDSDCGGGEQAIDHAILAVGYNLTAKTPYYIVKNSWGESWGESGYLRMKVGINLDCIACKATYPVASPQQPSKPPAPELQCPAGTFDPTLKTPRTCPKGSTCCCSQNYFWKKGQCRDTECCLEGETCFNENKIGGKHGCYKNSTSTQ
jgi:C1A family cysteine protease